MLQLTKIILQRELLITARTKSELLIAVTFFIIITSMFPLALTATTVSGNILPRLAPGIVWLAVILAILLSLETHYKRDYELGLYDELCFSAYPLPLIIFSKLLINWLLTIGPLLLVLPWVALLYGLKLEQIGVISFSLIFGSCGIYYLGALAATLTVATPKSSLLIFTIMLPLYTPLLIFATQAVQYNMDGLACGGLLAMLAALSLSMMLVLPFVIAFVVRNVRF
jgi:heme exporter protein B